MMRKKKNLKQEEKEEEEKDQEEVKVVKVQEELEVEVEVTENTIEKDENSESIINQITLDCMLNKSQYEKYLRRNLTKSINNNDKKFYRKRICNLTKELFKEAIVTPDIKYVFDNYVKICINYFKVMDRSDIIQEEYKELKETTEASFVSNEELTQSNSLLMRSVKVNPGLDNFVTVKMTKQLEQIIIPQQREINLRDPKLKKKGIVGKEKKNILINYDEQDKKNENQNETAKDNSKEEHQSNDEEA